LEKLGRAPSYVANVRLNLDRHLFPLWRDRQITSISRREAAGVLHSVEENFGHARARKLKVTGSALFNWALQQPHLMEVLEVNPFTKITMQGESRSRDRWLHGDEIAKFWSAAEKQGAPFGHLARVLLLTLARRSEVANMRWSDLDFKQRTWTIPSSMNKSRREHQVPLTDLAVEILTLIPRNEDGGFVFSTTAGARPVSGFSKAKKQLDKLAGIEERWTYHDLRRTGVTHLSNLGVAKHVQAALLNHAGTTVTDIYSRADLMRPKRRALEQWSRQVASISSGAPSNVVSMRRRH
jgi:integrase